jgi:8-oxo-dGTP diphosphatase
MTKPETPMLTVDIIIEIEDGIVLIERKNEPHGWALPGGCVDVGETCQDAAIREAKEETGLKINNVVEAGIYDAPDRDPRGHAVSITHYAQAEGTPVGADDAKNAIVIDPQTALDQYYNGTLVLCFDHKQIIQDYLDYTQQ